MKDLLFIMPSLEGGGAEKVLVNILNRLDYKKYNVDLLLFYNKGIYKDDINKNVRMLSIFDDDFTEGKGFAYNIRKIFFKIFRKIVFKFPSIVYKFILSKKYDVEIAFLEGFPMVFVSKSPNKNSKKITWIHTDLDKLITIPRSMEGRALKAFDKIICVSNDSMNSLINLYPDQAQKVQVIFNPIDQDNILRNSEESIDFNPDKVSIISVGRLNKVKGFDILIKAHKKVIEKGIEHNLYIIGEGDERHNLEKLISECDVADSVKLLGFKKNPYPYIMKTDIYVMASLVEGFPLSLAEAITLEKPIIATSCTGAQEILENGKYGFLVDINDVFLLADAIETLIINSGLREKYTLLSKERKEFFDINRVMGEIEKVIQ